MPAEWTPHARTWMELPAPDTDRAGFGPEGSPSLARAQLAWAGVANVLAGFEPVTVLVPPGYEEPARRMLISGVRIRSMPIDNAFLRDSGPTFVHAADGSLAAVTWVFNGWGTGHLMSWDAEQRVGRAVATAAGAPVTRSPLVLEGGALHVDGEGTVLVTESVALDPHRNPGWTRAGVEAELRERLGVTTVLWLPRGLSGDHDALGTQGHVDMLATFARPGIVLVHEQTDPGHPDHAVSRETAELLREAVDARGRRLVVIGLPASRGGQSYVNHYVANGVVLLGVFDDPADGYAAHLLRRVYRGRDVLMLDARAVVAHGGGLHSITQQQPAVIPTAPAAPCRPKPQVNARE